ncbi:MAG: MoaD/ThiS family protein [Acidobacteriota bacterium]|nr:MoaD/ThiS family protein [Acidobacteriota bacterium]
MVTVYIPSPLRPFTDQQAATPLGGGTVGEVLENFKARFPEAAARFFTLKTLRYLNLYLNEQDVRQLAGMETPVKDGDELTVVFAIAGGCKSPDGAS